jgi:hypothetical protein
MFISLIINFQIARGSYFKFPPLIVAYISGLKLGLIHFYTHFSMIFSLEDTKETIISIFGTNN